MKPILSVKATQKRFRDIIGLLGVSLCCFFASAHAGEGLAVVQVPVKSDEVVQRLHIRAFTYKFKANPGKMPEGYSIHFEHWRQGKLKNIHKTQIFRLNAKGETNPSFFISFPSPPRMDVLVSPNNGKGEFRGILPFSVSTKVESTADYLEASSILQLKEGASIALGYHFIGLVDRVLPDTYKGGKLYDDLEAQIQGYQDLIVKEGLKDVDLIVYRLVFKERIGTDK